MYQTYLVAMKNAQKGIYRVSQKTGEFSDELDIAFVMN